MLKEKRERIYLMLVGLNINGLNHVSEICTINVIIPCIIVSGVNYKWLKDPWL